MKKSKAKKIHLYNTFRPSIPLWETLEAYHPGEWVFVSMKKKYREGSDFKDLPGWQFRGNFKKRKITVVYSIKATLEIVFSGKRNRVYYTHPPLFFVLGLLFRLIRRDRYVIHVMDVFPEILYESIPWTKAFRFILDPLSIIALKKAEKVIVIGKCMEKIIRSKGIEKSRITYFPNFSGLEIPPVPVGIESRVWHIFYGGNIGYGHDLSSLLHLANAFPTLVRITIVGNGVYLKQTREIIERNGLANVEVYTNLDDETFMQHAGSADFHFINLRESYSGLMVPSKFYSALKWGIPVLYEGKKGTEIYEELTRNRFLGFAFENHAVDTLISYMQSVVNEGKTKRTDRGRIQDYYRENYEISDRIPSYYSLLEEAFGSTRR